mmetsp:Transcript_3990/g.7647  ORF Transcript_3990/g.7647 Transcript_3990/m.7647 type:complete len:239 (+) Transcript_3990:2053-2769(+)
MFPVCLPLPFIFTPVCKIESTASFSHSVHHHTNIAVTKVPGRSLGVLLGIPYVHSKSMRNPFFPLSIIFFFLCQPSHASFSILDTAFPPTIVNISAFIPHLSLAVSLSILPLSLIETKSLFVVIHSSLPFSDPSFPTSIISHWCLSKAEYSFSLPNPILYLAFVRTSIAPFQSTHSSEGISLDISLVFCAIFPLELTFTVHVPILELSVILFPSFKDRYTTPTVSTAFIPSTFVAYYA